MELKKCPFCNGEAKNEIDMPWRFVQCCQCGTTGPEFYSAAEAESAWNRRYVKECKWTMGNPDLDMWNTECGKAFTLNDGSPKDNEMKSCCFCGGKLIEIEVEDE